MNGKIHIECFTYVITEHSKNNTVILFVSVSEIICCAKCNNFLNASFLKCICLDTLRSFLEVFNRQYNWDPDAIHNLCHVNHIYNCFLPLHSHIVKFVWATSSFFLFLCVFEVDVYWVNGHCLKFNANREREREKWHEKEYGSGSLCWRYW